MNRRSVPDYRLFLLLVLCALLACGESPSDADIAPELDLDTRSITLTQPANQASLAILNMGDAGLEWEVASRPEWLTVSKSAGRVDQQPDSIQLTADLFLSVGSYNEPLVLRSNGGQAEVEIVYTVRFAIEVFPGEGAARIALGDPYSKVLTTYGISDDVLGVIDETGALTGHVVHYPGVGFWLNSAGNTPAGGDLVEQVTLELIYQGVTREFIGVRSSMDEVLQSYGAPRTVENDTVLRFDFSEVPSIIWTYDGMAFYFREGSDVCYWIEVFEEDAGPQTLLRYD